MARILYVSQGYSTHDRRFLEELAESVHEILYLPYSNGATCYEPRPLPAGIHQLAPLSSVNIPPGTVNWVRAAQRFRRVVGDVKPELVHAGPVQTGGFFAALAGFHPLLIMSWGSDVLATPDQSSWMRWVTEFTLQRADMALGDCNAVRDRISLLGALPDDRIVCFPWGIDQNRFRPKVSSLCLRKKLGWESCQVVVSARSFEPIHGTMVFLDAMKRVLQRQRGVRVLMLGDGSLKTQVKAYIEKNNLADRIYLAGHVPEELLADYFGEADLYVSTTCCDGSSISLLQAMACGLAAIVTDGYGNREWVIPGRNGWLCPAGDAETLAATVFEALRDDAARAAMCQINISTVRARANWKINFGKLLVAYDQLLFRTVPKEASNYAQLANR